MTKNSDNLIIFPAEQKVTIGDKEFTVQKFKLGKALRMLDYLSEGFEISDLASVAAAAEKGQLKLITELADRFPSISKMFRKVLPKIFALTLISDKRLAEIDENDESYEDEIKKMVSFLNENMPTEMAIEMLCLAIQGLGLGELRKNFPKLREIVTSL